MNIGAIGRSGEDEQAKVRNSSVLKSEGHEIWPGEKMKLQVAMSDFHSRMLRWTGRAGPLLNEPLVSSERRNAVWSSFSCVYLYPSDLRSYFAVKLEYVSVVVYILFYYSEDGAFW